MKRSGTNERSGAGMIFKLPLQCRRMKVFLVLLGLMLSACTQTPEVRSASYLAAGKKLLQKKDAPRAILQFRNALKATPDNPEVYYELGEAYSTTKDLSAALSAYRKTLEMDPKHPGARLRMAQMMVASSDAQMVKDARDQLKEMVKNSAATPEILNTIAFAELRLGNTESAVDSLDRVLSQSPGELGSSAM